MKKISLLFVIFLLLLTGCDKKNNKKEEKKEEQKIESKTDKMFVIISLYSNPSTGYSWKYEIDNENVEIEERYESHCTQNNVGCGGMHYYNVYGLKKGKSVITLKYKKGNEKTEFDRDAIYEVEVDENLNVSTISQKGSYFE